jgi:hypothetical protein
VAAFDGMGVSLADKIEVAPPAVTLAQGVPKDVPDVAK